MSLIHLFRIAEKLDKVPWNFIELVYDVLWAILFLIAASILTDYARKYQEMDSYAAGAVSSHSLLPFNLFSRFFTLIYLSFAYALLIKFFGYAAMLLYLIDAAFRFVAWQRGGSRLTKSSAAATTTGPTPTLQSSAPGL